MSSEVFVGTSFTEHRGKGFWARDGALELWLFLLAEEAGRSEAPADWLRAAAEDWRLQATVGFVGCVSASLDEHAPTQERAAVVLGLAERALERLRGRGEVLPA